MNMKTKKILFGIDLQDYLKASKKEKTKIIDNVVRQTKMHRISVIRAFRREQLSPIAKVKKSGRPEYYDVASIDALRTVWEVQDYACGELLHPSVIDTVNILQRDDMWSHSKEATIKLLEMSIATMKRHISHWNDIELSRKGISTTTPSSIKDRVPLFQGNWLEVKPGNGQIDTVAHCGNTMAGDFIFSLGYVDVSTGFTCYRAQWNKGMHATLTSLKDVREKIPFPLTMIHPDCGSEFLNSVVMDWAKEEGIEITRSRSYHKNDNGYVEQRNGHIARRWLGYTRLESIDLIEEINHMYDILFLYSNYFKVQRLCIGTKILENGKHRKVYENTGITPYQRVLQNEYISEDIKNKMKAERSALNPKLLRDELLRLKHDILNGTKYFKS
jgi:hypothetical protein